MYVGTYVCTVLPVKIHRLFGAYAILILIDVKWLSLIVGDKILLWLCLICEMLTCLVGLKSTFWMVESVL